MAGDAIELEDGEIEDYSDDERTKTSSMTNSYQWTPNFQDKPRRHSYESWRDVRPSYKRRKRYGSTYSNTRRPKSYYEHNGKFDEFKKNNVREPWGQSDKSYDLNDYELLLARHQLIQQQLEKVKECGSSSITPVEERRSTEVQSTLSSLPTKPSHNAGDNDLELETLRNVLLSQTRKRKVDGQKNKITVKSFENSNLTSNASEGQNLENHQLNFESGDVDQLGMIQYASKPSKVAKRRQKKNSEKKLKKDKMVLQKSDPTNNVQIENEQKVQFCSARKKRKRRGGKRTRLLAFRAQQKEELNRFIRELKEETSDNYNNIPMDIEADEEANEDGQAPLPLIETLEILPPLPPPSKPCSPYTDGFQPMVDIIPQYMTNSNVSWMPGYVESLYHETNLEKRASPSIEKNEPLKNEKTPGADDEHEVWALRAQALKSLACKRAAKAKELKKEKPTIKTLAARQLKDMPVVKTPPPVTTNSTDVFKLFPTPKHAPVIIHLSKDDFDCEEEGNQLNHVDQMFKEARQAHEKKSSKEDSDAIKAGIKEENDKILLAKLHESVERLNAKVKANSSSIAQAQLTYKTLKKEISDKRSQFIKHNVDVKKLQEKLQLAMRERNLTKKLHNGLHVKFKRVKDDLRKKICFRNNTNDGLLRGKSILTVHEGLEKVTLNEKMRDNITTVIKTLQASQKSAITELQTINKPSTTLKPVMVHPSTVQKMSKKDLIKLELELREKLKKFQHIQLPKKIGFEVKPTKSLSSPHKTVQSQVNDLHLSVKYLPSVKTVQDLKDLQKSLSLAPVPSLATTVSLLDSLENQTIKRQKQLLRTSDTSTVYHQKKNFLREVECIQHEPYTKYESVLRYFKSYRLCPYYRTQSKYSLQSATFCNRIEACGIMCKYDLFGTCNDIKCPHWHFKDKVTLQPSDVISDLASYDFVTFQATEEMNHAQKKLLLAGFTKQFIEQYSGKMSLEEQLLLLWNKLKESRRARKQFPSIMLNAREWIISGQSQLTNDLKVEHYTKKSPPLYFFTKTILQTKVDYLYESQEVRYFSETYDSVDVLERAIHENPSATNLWLALAKLRLRHGNEKEKEGMSNKEHALRVLSQGLEKNRESEELWIEYLNLFSDNSSSEELRKLCYQAVMYAATYDVWWTCLTLERTHLGKQEICTELVKFVLEGNEKETVHSHYLTETILYVARLLTSRGKVAMALDYISSALEGDAFDVDAEKLHLENVAEYLTVSDKALLWTCRISLHAFHDLPSVIFMSDRSDPGRLVNKRKFLLEWNKEQWEREYTCIQRLFDAALESLGDRCVTTMKSAMNLYENLVAFELAAKNVKIAMQTLRSLVVQEPSFVEAWVLLLSLYIKHSPVDAVVTVAEESLHKCDHDVEIVYFYTKWLYEQGMPSLALEKLTKCIHVYFEFKCDEDVPDVLHLYQKVLNLPVPYAISLPTYIPKTSEHLIYYYWMCYCLVLQIKNIRPSYICYRSSLEEAFESAVHQYSSRKNTRKLWLAYISYKVKFAESEDELVDLLFRCLALVSASEAMNTSVFWKDYSFHNHVLDVCLEHISRGQHAYVYRRAISLMPDNVHLAFRVCQYELQQKNYSQARVICGTVLDVFPHFLPLWQLAIQVELRCNCYQEARWLFTEATKHLPFHVCLWQEFAKFEVAQAGDATKLAAKLESIISKAEKSGVTINAFLK